MKSSSRYIAGLTLASFVFAAPVAAQESGSMQVGGATVTIGAGTAILTLPDVPSFVTFDTGTAPFPFINGFKFSDDFGDEIGWNVNGSIEVPTGATRKVSLNGFWANIDDKDSATCTGGAAATCSWYPLVDNPAVNQIFATLVGEQIVSTAKRDVDHWGASLESKWQMNPGVMGVTQAPHRRSFALGADIRGIDQDLDVALRLVNAPLSPGFGPATYTEELDTRYYGAYAAWGGDYSIPFLSGMTGGLGLQSSFLLRGGIYYADTDYQGRLVDNTLGALNATSALSLSRDEVSFIGGLVLETKKRFGRRATLSLKSTYEYYSYVPEMAYNTVDLGPAAGSTPFTPGRQAGTRIGDDDAFSAMTSLRLTIKLGPDSVMEPR